VSPLQETLRISLALSDNQMALLQGPALALPLALASIPLGMLIDRRSRVRLLLIFAMGTVAAGLLTTMASGLVMLVCARVLMGLTAAATSITVYSTLADH
jgi:MFS family permease